MYIVDIRITRLSRVTRFLFSRQNSHFGPDLIVTVRGSAWYLNIVYIVYFDDNLYPGLSIYINLRPVLWDIGKQCGPSSDIAERMWHLIMVSIVCPTVFILNYPCDS